MNRELRRKEQRMLRRITRGTDIGEPVYRRTRPIDLRLEEEPAGVRAWKTGSSEVVRRFLAEDYDPATMPTLITCTRAADRGTPEEGTPYLVGWAWEGTAYPPLRSYLGLEPE